MTEQLLQFIWRYQYFNRGELATAAGEQLTVVKPGMPNRNQGPDFLDAVLIVGNVRWSGSIELHLRTTDWRRHRHESDRNYTNVILHVVWQHDGEVNDLPVLELCNRVPGILLSRYEALMDNQAFIPCNANTRYITSLGWLSWKDRLLFERMERKAAMISAMYEQAGRDWRTVTWWVLARGFGSKVNADAFEQVARTIPLAVIRDCRRRLRWLEALLLGQAGLLEETAREPAGRTLQAIYAWLQHKHHLRKSIYQVRRLRMRPHSLPHLRLVQLAMLLHRYEDLEFLFPASESLASVKQKLQTEVSSDTWMYFSGRKKKPVPIRLGAQMINHLLINVVVPLLFVHGRDHPDFMEKAVGWLRQLRRENNSLTRRFEAYGFSQDSAFDSQAMIELKSQYCDLRRCLECAVGYSILNPMHPNQS